MLSQPHLPLTDNCGGLRQVIAFNSVVKAAEIGEEENRGRIALLRADV